MALWLRYAQPPAGQNALRSGSLLHTSTVTGSFGFQLTTASRSDNVGTL